jgi:hypothetical protein
MAVPQAHWLAPHDLTTPANHRPHGSAGTTANTRSNRPHGSARTTGPAYPTRNMGSVRYQAVDGAPVVDARRRTVSRLINAVVFLFAVWLTVSADPVAYVGTGRFDVFWNHAVVGLAVGAVALVRVAKPAGTGALVLTNSLLGGWLMISPFWYGYGGGLTDALALWNDVLVGGAVLLLTLATAALRDRGSDDELPPLGDTDRWQLR